MKRGRFLLLLAGALAAVHASPVLSAPDKPKDALDAVLFGADEPTDKILSVAVSDDGTAMRIAGDIETGAYRKVRRLLEPAAKVRTIWLESDGGMVLEAFLIAAMIRERQMDTFVDANCASACTLILAAGKSRAAYARAKIGFHNSVALDEKGNLLKGPRAERENKEPDFMQAAAFHRAGIAEGFVKKALATPHTAIWEPPHTEMLEAHVLTRSLSDGDRLAMKGWGPSWPEIDASLRKDSIARIIAETDPKGYEAAVSSIWSRPPAVSGGLYGYTARLLAGSIHDRALSAPDPLLRRYVDFVLSARLPGAKPAGIWTQGEAAGKASDVAASPPCPNSPLDFLALQDAFAKGPDAEGEALVKALFSTPQTAREIDWKGAEALYTAYTAAVEARIEPDRRKRRKVMAALPDCAWEKASLEEVRSHTGADQLNLIRAVAMLEMD